MNELVNVVIIFSATFFGVFLLGIQSLNVNGGHRLLAFVTSIGISTTNYWILIIMPVTSSLATKIAFFSGGPLGIVCAMIFHPYLVKILGKPK